MKPIGLFFVSQCLSAIVGIADASAKLHTDGDGVDGVDEQHRHRKLSNGKQHHRHSTYVIGDLHGDADCAKHWVARTGLVENLDIAPTASSQWTWADPTSTIVFLGDYVDKGPQCKQTLEFVKNLTVVFPTYVTALMGNHELELLLDRNGDREEWDHHRFMDLAYASLHPLEYVNYVDDTDSADRMVLEAVFNATMQAYARNHHNAYIMTPTLHPETGKRSILEFIPDPELRAVVAERLAAYQSNYIASFRSGTELGDWLEQRPILHVERNTVFAHGGIRPMEVVTNVVEQVMSSKSDAAANIASSLHQTKMRAFQDDLVGQVTYDLVTYRGNHPPEGDCQTLRKLLSELGVSKLAVGHTPNDDVQILCGGQFLALDSSLSRWFRANGNEYCHGEYEYGEGNSVCRAMEPTCQGQIVRIDEDGNVEVMKSRHTKTASHSEDSTESAHDEAEL